MSDCVLYTYGEQKVYMHVAHIIKVTRISGAERHLLVLLKGLREQGIDAHLIILTQPNSPMNNMIAEAEQHGIPIHNVTIYRHYDLTVVWRIRKILRDIQPDIVHTHLIHADLYGWLGAKIAWAKTIISSRHNDDNFRYHRLIRLVSRVMWWLTDGGIAISGAIKKFVVDVEGARDDKIDVVHYGMDYRWTPDEDIWSAYKSLRDELGLPRDTVILGMVNRLVEQKGIPYALQAFQVIITEFPQVHLVIAGDGDGAETLKKQADKLGISSNVHWLGWRNDAQALMGAFDVFLLPSLWEGFGLVLLEAMARRIPIVASSVSAIPEVVAHGENGLLIPPRDVDGLVNAIRLLLNDRPLRKYMGLLGDERLEQVFHVQQMVNATIAVYDKRCKDR